MILSALAFAGLDLIRKLLAGRIDTLALVLFMSLGAVPFLAALLALHGLEVPSAGYVLPGLLALTLNFLGSLGFVHSVKLSPLSRTIPLLSLTPVFTALTAVPLLGELPDATQTAGILLVVVGAMALNAEGSLGGAARGLLREKGALIMIAVALMWPAFICITAAYVPGNLRSALRHPMLVGVKLWALAHLIANGDLGSIVLFGAMLAWAVYDRVSLKYRSEAGAPPIPAGGRRNDIIAIVVGTILYLAFGLVFHPLWIGVAVFGTPAFGT